MARQTVGKEPIARHLARVALYELKGKSALYPNVREKFEKLQARMKQLGMPIYLVEGFRTAKKQNEYYARGRTKEGKIITNAKGLQSYHQFCISFDVAFVKYNWNPPYPHYWEALRIQAERLNLEGIGEWDPGHFEMHPGFTWRDLESYFK